MVEENEKKKQPPQITDEYKSLQVLRQLVDTLKEINVSLKFIVADINRNRGM